MLLNEIYRQLETTYPEMVSIRRDLHQHPELSFQEVHTPKKVADYLSGLGIEVRTEVGGRGVVGILRGALPGKTVALRADFDALPIQDEKDVPYKSTVPGIMHACGHDGHTATLLAVAKVLSQHRAEIKGNIVFIHQFAEEMAPGGAIAMIEDGCLVGVDAIFGTHLSSNHPTGTLAYRVGPTMAAADRFEIDLIGRGGHGAAPHETVDPIVMGGHLIVALQQIVSRKVNPTKPAVVTVGAFHAGEAFNVIPDRARLVGTVRTFDEEIRCLIEKEIGELATSISQSAGGSCEYKFARGYPALHNHSVETLFLAEVARGILGSENVFEMDPIMGGEDFAYYLQNVPGTFFFTGASNPDLGANYPHHHPMFDIDESGMLIAAKTLAAAAIKYLSLHATDDSASDEELNRTA
jgi:amidohydrolase